MLKTDATLPGPTKVHQKDVAPNRAYLYRIYLDIISTINKLNEVRSYMEYTQPWSEKGVNPAK